ITLVDPDEVDDDALVVASAFMGAPTVVIEKIPGGDEPVIALRRLEQHLGRSADAIIPMECGGLNSMIPLLVAARTGLPVVDGDGMGRAFPELQMCTFFVYGLHPSPAAIADEKDNVVVFTGVKDMYWLERLSRATAVDMGATAGYATPPMRGEFVRRVAVPGTVTQAIDLGQAVFGARKRKENPVQAILRACHGVALFEGKIVDLDRRLARGFAVGRATLHGLGPYSGSELMIDLQNENLIAIRDGVPVATVPDLICMVDLETGEAITTEVLRYGLRVAVLGLPCHDLMRTPEALRVFGPRAFGYDLDFHPLPQGGV
ncbi:MAG: DUF917 domain-containing protein, partial [Candidatus Dormibacteria bacterium]